MFAPNAITRSKIIVIATICIHILLETTSTWACSCFRQSVEEDFQDADAVFSGKVLLKEEIDDERQIKWGEFEIKTIGVELELDQSWKGTASRKVTVLTEAYTASCGYTFTVGESYVVFASSREVKVDEEKNKLDVLYTGYCWSNRKLEDSSETESFIKQLEDLKSETSEEAEDEHSDKSEEVEDSQTPRQL